MEKLITISLAVMSSIFVVFLLVMIFNTNAAEEANNKVVHALFGVFTLIFLVLTTMNIMSAFSETERINQILLFKTKNSEKRASVALVRKLAKQAAKTVEGAKISHLNLYADATNEVIVKAAVKVDTGDNDNIKASDILDRVNTALVNEFMNVLGFEFKMIELKLTSIKQNERAEQAAVQSPEAVKPIEVEVIEGTEDGNK